METIILFGPLIGALICGFGWKFIGEMAAMWVSTGHVVPGRVPVLDCVPDI